MTQPGTPQTTRAFVLPPITDPTVHAEIDRLARRYLAAGGIGMDLISSIGGRAEAILHRLPKPVRRALDKAVLVGLRRAFDAAQASRGVMRPRGDLFNRALSTVSGAAGGLGGMAGALIELPLTITWLLRGLLEIAAEHGLDPDSDEVRAECLRIFASAGPGVEDDGTDMGLLAAKLSVTGQTLGGLISRVAPKLSASMGQKLAAQATPVLGAVAGASINYTFARYYQELARVHFGLMRLSQETGLPEEALTEQLELRIKALQRG